MPTVPITLRDGRLYQVEISPLNCGAFLQQFAAPRLTARDDELLVVPSPYLRTFGACISGVGIIWLVVAIIAAKYGSTTVSMVGAGCGSVMIPIGLFFLLSARKILFERRRGIVRITSAISKQEYRLTHLIATQAIFAGWHTTDDDNRRVATYQCNLVFDDPRISRVPVANLAARDVIVDLAASIGAFLNVPVIQHIETTDRTPS